MNDEFRLLKIKPSDTLFFGGGRSFNKGENSWHQSRIVPYPSVFYGAICSAMLEKCPNRQKDYFEASTRYNKKSFTENFRHRSSPGYYLTLGSIYLCEERRDSKSCNLYIQAPKDLFVDTDSNIHYGHYKKINSVFDCSLKDFSFYMHTPEKNDAERADGMFIDWISFLDSYFHNSEDIELIGFDNLATYRFKVGISIDKKKKTVEEHLYRLDMLEFHQGNWSYVVEYKIDPDWWSLDSTNLDCLGKGFLKLGGENKACSYEQFENTFWNNNYFECTEVKNDWEYVKLYVKTPAFFANNSLQPVFATDEIEVLASVISKPYYIGGFDMILKKPRPMRTAIPEGCVYLLKSNLFKDKTFYEIRDIIAETIICNNVDRGFGQFEVLPLYKNQIGG